MNKGETMSDTEINILVLTLIVTTVTLLIGYYETANTRLLHQLTDINAELQSLRDDTLLSSITCDTAALSIDLSPIPPRTTDWLTEPPFNLVDTTQRMHQLRKNNEPIYWGD